MTLTKLYISKLMPWMINYGFYELFDVFFGRFCLSAYAVNDGEVR